MKTFGLWVFILQGFITNAQVDKSHEFVGTIQLEDKSFITYKLNFIELEDGAIEGFSVTDFEGTHRTKSKIVGELDKKGKTISFRETTNTSTKSDVEPEQFCYLHVKDVRMKSSGGKVTIQGPFTGKYPDGKSCINGNVFLLGSDFLFKKLDKKSAHLAKSKNVDSTGSEEMSSALLRKRLDLNSLGADEELKINWISKEVVIEIWDAETVDQDIISIYVNGKGLLKEYRVQKSKKTLKIPFEEETCTIKILAVSEGKTPPNTTHVLLIDKENAVPIVTNLKEGEKALIILERGG